MSIKIQPRKSDQVRALRARHAYLSPKDIAGMTGVPLQQVKRALERQPKDQVKSVVH